MITCMCLLSLKGSRAIEKGQGRNQEGLEHYRHVWDPSGKCPARTKAPQAPRTAHVCTHIWYQIVIWQYIKHVHSFYWSLVVLAQLPSLHQVVSLYHVCCSLAEMQASQGDGDQAIMKKYLAIRKIVHPGKWVHGYLHAIGIKLILTGALTRSLLFLSGIRLLMKVHRWHLRLSSKHMSKSWPVGRNETWSN